MLQNLMVDKALDIFQVLIHQKMYIYGKMPNFQADLLLDKILIKHVLQ